MVPQGGPPGGEALILAALVLATVAELMRDLGSDTYEAREAAQDALLLAGPEADSSLALATQSSDMEVAERARLVLLQRKPISVQELLDHAQDLEGRQVTCRGLLQGGRLGRISPDPAEEAREGLEILPGSAEVAKRLGALDWMEVLATGAVGKEGEFTVQDVRAHRPGFEPGMARVEAGDPTLEERLNTEVVAVGEVTAGSPIHAAALGGYSLGGTLDLSGQVPREGLGGWVGKRVEVRGFLRAGKDGKPTLRMRDLRSAP